MKKISIMVTSYNLEDYIDTSIQSVVEQDMPCDWELLVGDDGSTDRTVEHINKWMGKYPENIKLFTIPRDNDTQKVGSRAARNRAYLLEQATGDYLNYLDGDDCWLGTEKLKKQFELLESPEYANCSCCAHNIEAYVIPENRRYLITNESVGNRVFQLNEYWKHFYFHTNTILFRKECKEKLLDPIYRDFLNDNFITFLILQYGDVIYLKDVWSRYNMTGNGLWTGNKKIYGLFRNLIYVDLEIRERPDLRDLILYRHYSVFMQIFTTYNYDAEFKTISPLICNLSPQLFTLSSLLSRGALLSDFESQQIHNLKKELKRIHIHRLYDRIIRKINQVLIRKK